MLTIQQLQQALHAINPEIAESGISAIRPHFSLREYDRGSPLLQQGDHWNHAILIESGLIRLHFLHADGREYNKSFFAENSLLCPLTPSMQSAPSLFGISCIETTKSWQCPIDTFINKLNHTDWQAIQRELMIRLLDSKLQREHDLLALDGQRRYDKFCRLQPHLAERIPLMHQASFLGLTDVTLSRLRRKLKNR